MRPSTVASWGRFLPTWHGLNSDAQGQERLIEVIAQLQALPLPWSTLIDTLLPQRIKNFSIDALDMLCATGAITWIGCSALGPRDGRVALFLREQVTTLLAPTEDYEPPSRLHEVILEQIRSSGACFLNEIESAARTNLSSLSSDEFREALWDLVWASQITNDTLSPLRGLGAKPSRRRGRNVAPAGGRWSLVSRLTSTEVSDTERTVARANLLLERYGLVARETARIESIVGGYSPIYKVLKAMEEAGRIRRGYFVEGLGGAQFAHVGAVDRLRSHREDDEPWTDDDFIILATADPANPWGALIPWPVTGSESGKPRRIPKTWTILARGRPALYLSARGTQILTFPDVLKSDPAVVDLAFRALLRVPKGKRRRSYTIEKIDSVDVRESEHYERLLTLSFEKDYRGVSTPVIV